MKRISMALVALLGACGELSNDDLVFLRGVPQKEELSLDVEEAVENGLVGAPAEFYAFLIAASEETNNDVANLLDFVDSIGKGYPPTTREHNLRVWGPVRNVDGSGTTVRFEVRREGDTFRYCLHTARDSEVTGEPTCDDIPGGFGMVAILYGEYRPRTVGGGARESDGVATLDMESAFQRGLGFSRGKLVVTHAYAEDGDTKQLTITADAPQIGLQPAVHAAYSYDRDVDGRVQFSLEAPGDFIETTRIPEDMQIDACWREGSPGRANVVISGGDLLGFSPATAVECWDGGIARTYASFELPDFPIYNSNEGNIAACPPPNCE
ncbi:MAG: hypothetical protein ACAI38_22355 [Myxococcota bacterium]|nr:hypothetical protein [Myxococcota bacterium]